MTFPNAAKGVKRIYTAMLLSLIAGAGSVIVALIALVTIAFANADDNTAAAAAGGGMLAILALGIAVLSIVVYILTLTGVYSAAKDDGSFKAALYVILIGIIISFVGMLLKDISLIYFLTQFAVEIANLLSAVYIINGIRNISRKLNNNEMTFAGGNVLKLIVVLYALSAVSTVLGSVFYGKDGTVLSSVFTMIAAALHIVKDIFLLLYLKRANQMLN